MSVGASIMRALFMAVFAIAGFLLAREAYVHVISLHVASGAWLLALTVTVPLVGALVGLFVAPYVQALFEAELDVVEHALERLGPHQIIGGVVGLMAGLIVAFLIRNVFFDAIAGGGPAGAIVATVSSIVLSVFAAFLGARVGAKQKLAGATDSSGGHADAKLIDTSVIVDGRIIDIVASGFFEGPLIVPRFVLRELHTIADSADPHKRARGRRGLELLAKLQERVALVIDERDYVDVGGVDAKLVRLARECGAKLMTNDYNLNRIAQVEGVVVLNINELADAVKAAAIPGEELHIAIVRDGKEPGQGVGYLDDGTMVVVENGRPLIGEETEVHVTSVLQTVTGRMIFAKPKRSSGLRT